jgi:hypothetical protein
LLSLPLRLTTWGLLGAVLVTVKVPDCPPEPPGSTVTVAVQLAPGATASQLLDWPNLPLDIVAWMNCTVDEVLLV